MLREIVDKIFSPLTCRPSIANVMPCWTEINSLGMPIRSSTTGIGFERAGLPLIVEMPFPKIFSANVMSALVTSLLQIRSPLLKESLHVQNQSQQSKT